MPGPIESVNKAIEIIDHPLIFAFAMVLMIVPMMAMMTVFFKYLGWSGPASLVQTP
jgi:hypothetical protein